MCLLYQRFYVCVFFICALFKRCIFKSLRGTFKILKNKRHQKQCGAFQRYWVDFVLLKIYFHYFNVIILKPRKCNNHLNTMNCENFRSLRSTTCLSYFRGKENKKKCVPYIKGTFLRVQRFLDRIRIDHCQMQIA